ncbi:MAG: hypothetical protein BWX73_02754 [Lentisphaerae bacterium ADurb.Bin082]|nr:MAG: hypothetical protein BWX73_02754 [Lentisphaerae bacterium ADurb.Bin082]
MSLRSLIIGFLGAIFIASCGYINDCVLGLESFTNGQLLPIIVIGLVALVVLLVNPAIGFLRPRYAFRTGELALIVLLWSASCSIPGRGLLEQFTHTMIMPFHWNRVTPGWQQNDILSYAPKEALVDVTEENYDQTVGGYIMGAPKGVVDERPWHARLWSKITRVPWRAWWPPLRTWMPLVLLSALASVCLALITYKQWSAHEFLSFPIAEFNATLIEQSPGRLWPAVFRNRLFWIGFIILVVIRVNNGLCVWYPDYYIPIRLNWSLAPFAQVWPQLFRVQYGSNLLALSVFPLVVAFAFFLSTEISLTLGLSQLCWVLTALPMVTIGMNLSTDWIGGWQGWQRAGSYIAMFFMLMYTGRNYYRYLLVKAFRPLAADEPERANVWATRLLMVAFVLMTYLVWRLGLELPFALITVFLTLLSFVVVSRISAETGLFFIQPRWTIFGLLLAGLGTYTFSPEAQVICGLVCVMLCIDQCQAFMPFLTNGLRLCDRAGVKPAKAGVTSMAMYTVAVVIAVVVIIVAVYEFGAPTNMNWHYQRIPTMSFRSALPEVLQLKSIGCLEEVAALPWWSRLSQIAPKDMFVGAFSFGIIVVLFFSFLRLRVPKWPLHPVMFLLWATYPMAMTCHSFFIGWMLKKAAVRFGGIRMARVLRPLMIGIIAGEIIAAVIFMIVGFLYYLNTGQKPLPYRWFPR